MVAINAFWQDLSLAGAALQTVAYAHNEVLLAFKKQVTKLDLWGGILLLEGLGERFQFTVVVPPSTMPTAIQQKIGGAEDPYAGVFEVRQWPLFQQVMGIQEPVWVAENRSVWQALLGADGVQRLPEALLAVPVIYAPILYKDECIGLVYLGGERLEKAFGGAVMAFGRQIGIALHNARLFQGHQEMEVVYRSQRDLAQQYLDIAEVVFLILGCDGRISMINRKGCQLLGYTEEALLGKNWFLTCLPTSIGADIFEKFKLICQGKAVLRTYDENPVITQTGEERLLAWHNALLHDVRGRVVGTISSGQDITERKQTENALAASERRFRAIFRQTFHLLGLLDVTGHILETNERALSFLGLRMVDVRGRLIWEALSGMATAQNSRNEIKTAVSFAAEGEMIKNIETTLRTIDGRRRLIEFSVKPISDDDGQVELLLLEGRDITEQRQIADTLYRSEKMATLQRLAEGVGANFTQIMEVGNLKAPPVRLGDVAADVQQYIATLQAMTDGVKHLNQQILMYAGQITLKPQTFEFNAFLNERDGLWRQLCGDKVAWQMVLSSEPFVVQADPELLATMLGLLIENSVEGMVGMEGGQVGVATRLLEIGWQDHSYWQYTTNTPLFPGRYANLLIQDTGIGMDQETMKHIFEPFFSTKPGRRGLGLAVALGIVRQHRGGIAVTSQIGKGSTIQVVLPLVAEG